MKMREFTQNDYYLYGGAEKFSDNSNPMIYANSEYVITADKNGIELEIEFDETDETYTYLISYRLSKEFLLNIAEMMIAELESKDSRAIVEYLREVHGLEPDYID